VRALSRGVDFSLKRLIASNRIVNLNGKKYAEAHRYTEKGYFGAGTGIEYYNTFKPSSKILTF
jgi:hypothetical protein